MEEAKAEEEAAGVGGDSQRAPLYGTLAAKRGESRRRIYVVEQNFPNF